MYICERCGKTFDNDEVVVIHDDPSPSGVSLSSGYYTFEECPYCGSDEIAEADICPSCDEWHNNRILCDDCMDAIKMKLEKIRLDHRLTQDDFEEVICEIFGW